MELAEVRNWEGVAVEVLLETYWKVAVEALLVKNRWVPGLAELLL